MSKKTKGEIKNKKDDEIKRLKKHIKELEKAEAERKQAEKALKKSEKQYRSLVETIEEGVGNVDEKENFTLVNQAAADIFGYTKKEMIGKNLKEFTSLKMFQQILKQTSIRKKGESSSYEISILRKNGEERIVTVTATPIINKNGEHQGAFGIFHDITERKKAEQKLYESKERFRKIYEHMAVGIAQVSLDFHIKSANKAYCNMLEYSEEELIGKHLKDITHPDILEENLRKQSQLTAGEIDHYRMEKQFILKNGNVVYGILDANLVRDSEGKPSYFLGSVIDITDRKKAEEELKKHQDHLEELVNERTTELEEKNKELNRFNKLFVGREFRIKELKDKVKKLEKELARKK